MRAFLQLVVRRPIGVAVLYLAVTLCGVVALRGLAVDLLPAVEVPNISITTQYEGVAPEEVETLITRPIEQRVSTLEGLERIEAVSSEGLSRVQLQFAWGTPLDEALDEVRVALDRLRSTLPEEADAPSLFKFDLSSVPVAQLGLSGEGDPRKLKFLATDEISRALERVPGVASVDVNGGQDREIRVSLDGDRLAALGISASEVSAALSRENRTVSAGELLSTGREVVVRTAGEFASLDDIQSVVIATREGQPIYLRDLARVEDTHRRIRSELWVDGAPGIRLRIYKQSGANTVDVAAGVRQAIHSINKQYGARAQLSMLWDSSTFIRSAVDNVQSGAVWGAGLAVIALLIFLRSLRATVVVGLAIPLSILATFGLMFFQGMTLNIISFGGLALGIGMLVDGAIVILENIYRRRAEGLSAADAAVEGTAEMAGPVVAGTLTTIAVFAPVVFVGGFAGVFFGEMALVVTFALCASLVVAMTLVPMLAARLLKSPGHAPGPLAPLAQAVESRLARLEAGYGRALRSAMSAPWAVICGASVLFVASCLLLPRVGMELMPNADEGQIDVKVELPVGTPLDETKAVMLRLTQLAHTVIEGDELDHLLTSAGPESWWRPGGSNEGKLEIRLVSASQRERSTAEILAELNPVLSGVPGTKVRLQEGTSNILARIVRGGDERLAVEIRGHDLETAARLSREVTTLLKGVTGVTYARPDRELGQLERVIQVDRARAAELGLGSADVAAAVEHYVLGRVATRFREDGDEYDVRVQLAEEQRQKLEQLPDMTIVSATGQRVPLSSLVTLEQREGPTSISRIDQERVLRVNAGTVGRPLAEVGQEVARRLEGLSVPEGFSVTLGGELSEQDSTFGNLMVGIALALFLVYAVMAVQFESVRQPLVVMASVPFAFTGGVVALLVSGTTFNMNSFLGAIVLVGIVVNNAIVLVDSAGAFRAQGMELQRALCEAGTRRLRPILMTTLTTLLGLVPLAFATGEGSETQGPLARVVVGGLTTSTLVTLFLVPCVYLLAERAREGRAPRADELHEARAAE